MSLIQKYQITPRYLTGPSRRRPRVPLSPGAKFLVAHDTGNPGSRAAQNVAYYERTRNEQEASAHIFVDDREILECIPALTAAAEKAHHVRNSVARDNQLFGFNANDAAIAVEYCFGGPINADAAYDKYVWVLARLCHEFDLDPRTLIVGHFFLDPTRRTDPTTGLASSRRTYDQLLRDVAADYDGMRAEASQQPVPGTIFPPAGNVITTARLNIRQGAPHTRAPISQTVAAGTRLAYNQVVRNGESVNGNQVWLGDANGNYFWSGATQPT
ncbi:MAG TPA: peptidoglycan recognition family protein [Candidatus Tectomicrobia bacterium]